MDITGKTSSIENQILAAIKYIENKKKKRTDLERICKVVVNTNNGLSKDDIVNTVLKMHKEKILKIKRYEDGPESYKINKDCEEMNTLCEDHIVQNNENIGKKEEENEHVQENEISKEDTVNEFELQIGQNSDGDNVNENEHGKFDEKHTLEDSFLAFLDGVRTPEKSSRSFCQYGKPVVSGGAPNSGPQGLEDHSSLTKSIDPPPTQFNRTNSGTHFDSLMEVIGKMADTISSQVEMLRDEKILNRMRRNTIDILKDDIADKATRIKELETILESMSKPSHDNVNTNSKSQQCSQENAQKAYKAQQENFQKAHKDQQVCEPPEIEQTQVTPSFASQLEDYVKSKREKYEEHLVKCKAEEMHSLKRSQQKPDKGKIHKKNKRNKQNKVTPEKVNHEQSTSEKSGLESETNDKEQTRPVLETDADKLSEKAKKTSNHTWKKGTVLITGDSMLNGIEESKLQMKCDVKLRAFSGATTEDMHSYLKPLLKKEPSTVILHIGTNDATENGIDSDQLVKRILDLKDEIEKMVHGCKVIISLPIRRNDNLKANKILSDVREKIISLKLDTINNTNIMNEQLGRRGLHLNQHGNARFAQNLINKLRYV